MKTSDKIVKNPTIHSSTDKNNGGKRGFYKDVQNRSGVRISDNSGLP